MKHIGLLFDLDGTLLNTLEDLTDATNHTLEAFGCPRRTLEEIRSFVGNGALHQIQCSLPGTPQDPPAEKVLAAYKAYYNAHAQIKTRPYPGILSALQELQQQFPIGIVSNKPDATVKLLCRHYFGGIYALGESEACPRKPAPQMLQLAMKALEVETCIYVGDSEVDILTAQNAGVPCLSVLWGFRDRQFLAESGGRSFCSDIRSMPEILRSMAERTT